MTIRIVLRTAIAIWMLCCALFAVATVTTPQYKNAIGGFGAILLVTTDSETALENWAMPTEGVYIPTTAVAKKGQPVEALVLFQGCEADTSGNCIAEVDYRIIAPDGSVYAEYLATELWKHKPAIPKGQVGLAVARVGLIVEPDEQAGRYMFSCTVRDLVGGVEFVIAREFEIVEVDEQ